MVFSVRRHATARVGIRRPRERVRWVRAIRLKLAGSPSLAVPFPEEPNGMHWRARTTGFNAKPRGTNVGYGLDWKAG